MNEIIKLFDIPYEILKENETHRRVYSGEGIAPCVCARIDSAKIVVEKDDKLQNVQSGFSNIRKE